MSDRSPTSRDVSWHATQRWQQYDGEFRANVLRIICLGVFYAIHLWNYYQPFGVLQLRAAPSTAFHQAVTILVATWVLMALAVNQCLRNQIFPRWLPFVTTGADLALLTAILCLGRGLQSPLVIGYPLVLILASLRFHLPLVRLATAAAGIGYLFVCAASRWPALLGGRKIDRVPRYHQIITLVAIIISGIMLGQFIRRFRAMAEWYADRAAGDSNDD